MIVFGHPGVLWLLPLAAVPVALHLLSRLAPPALRFPAVRFLLSSPMPLQGRRRWQDVLLMAVRTLLVAAAVLLAAAPRWQELPQTLDASEKAVAAVLDSSASMAAYAGEFQEELQKLPRNVRFWRTDGRECASWQDWRPGLTAPESRMALQAASQWLAGFPSTHRVLHLFSDLQTANWADALPSMPEGTEVVIHAPENSVRENCGFTGVRVEGISETELRVQVHYHNWGDEARNREMVLLLDGREWRQAVACLPQAEGVRTWVVPVPQDGHGKVSMLPSDGFAFDDERLFWARGESPHPVLAVFAGQDEALADELEYFTVPALMAEPDGAPPRYDVSVLDAMALAFADLSDVAAVYLLGAADRLSSEELAALKTYVEQGGVLFAVPGASPLAGWRSLQEAGLAPRGAALLEKRPTGIGAVPSGSPLAGLFSGKTPADLHFFAIRRHLNVAVDDVDAVLLKTLEGQPALLQRRLGKGQLFLFTFGFHQQDSELPLTKSFLPLLRELSDQALAGRTESIRLACGEALPKRKELSGEELAGEVDTSQPGLFRLGRHLVEVNPPLAESIPHYIPVDEMQRKLNDAEGGTAENELLPATGRSLLSECALTLLALLLAEAILALPSRR